jgi:hypothetical protein
MAQNDIVGQIPAFTEDTPSREPVREEEKQPVVEPAVDELVTPELPAEQPAGNASVDTTEPNTVVQDTEGQKALKGLQEERVKLLKEIADLRGQKREIKQDQITRVEQQIDELKDLNPDDVNLIERVIRSKGYVNKEEANQMFYKAVEQEELGKFLDKYPEYKPENDPSDANWSLLQKELGFYKLPSNPKQITEILERAHRSIIKVPSGPSLPVQQRRVQTASAGAGGTPRPSSSVSFTFDADKRAMLKAGGFSEEDIKSMEAKQSS